MNHSTVFITTDPESLYLRLEKNLYRSEASFRQLVIVPHDLVRRAISSELLKGSLYAGIKVLELSSAIDYLTRLVRFDDKKGHSFPAPMLFSLHLEELIGQMLEENEALFSPLKDYVFVEKTKKGQERKKRELAEALSLDFLHYGVYGGKGLVQWLQKSSWKQKLWQRAFALWDYPYHAFKQLSEKKELPIIFDIHLFGFDAIPLIYEGFFSYLSQFFPFFTYFFTPSKAFWGEALSTPEFFYKKNLYKEKGVLDKELELLKEYQKQEHPLLLNFAKCSQQRLNFLIDLEVKKEEFFYESPVKPYLLDHLKNSLFNGEFQKQVVVLDDKDESIRIHGCPTKKREVEVFLKQMMQLMDKNEIEPSDVLVLAPDISIYEPYIKQVVSEQAGFSYQIFDLPILSQSPFLQGLWALFSLFESRAELKEMFHLLHSLPLLKKWELSFEEIQKVKQLCRDVSITWGLDQAHREELLESAFSSQGTWLEGFYRLLIGLVVGRKELITKETSHYAPLGVVELEDADLIAKLYFFIQELIDFRQRFLNKEQTLDCWVKEIKCCAETFFNLDPSDEGVLFFYQQLKGVEQLSLKVHGAKYSFTSIKRLFEKTFNKKGGMLSCRNQQALTFASIDSQMLYPSKIIYFLGMEEGAFPSKEQVHPLREIEKSEMDPFPSLIEEQRQLLLNAFVYAKEGIYFSYCFFDDQDGKEKELSFLIQEVIEVLESCFTYLTSGVAKKIFVKHKACPFHVEELLQGCFSLRHISLAKAYYEKEKERRHLFSHLYTKVSKEIVAEKHEEIQLKDLEVFAKNPLRQYMQKTLSMRIKKEKTTQESKENEFALSYLDRALFQKELFHQDFDISALKMQASGRYPLGVFHDLATNHLKEEELKALEFFHFLGIEKEKIFSIQLSKNVEEKELVEKGLWLVPALKVKDFENHDICIEGRLENVTEKGLLFFGEDRLEDFVKIWPTYLVFLLILERDFSNQISHHLVCIKEKVIKSTKMDDPGKALQEYLGYYFKAQKEASPLHPQWASSFIEGDAKQKKEQIYKSFTSSASSQRVDDYQKWVYEHLHPFAVDAIEHTWSATYHQTFSPLVKWAVKKEIYG